MNGTTASRNRFGQYRRTRSSPVQPRTAAQLAVRSVLADVSSLWRTLDDVVREAWNTLALGVVKRDSLGQQYTPTGHQLFVARNAAAVSIGTAVPVSPLPATDFPAMVVTAVEAVAPDEMTVTHGAVPAGVDVQIWASPGVSAGRKFQGDYRLISVINTAAPGPTTDIGPTYQTRLGNLVAGQKVFARARYVDTVSGDEGPWTEFSFLVDAAA